MKITVRISNSLLQIVESLPREVAVERCEPVSIRQLAKDLNVPLLLVAIPLVNGQKRPLDFILTESCDVDLIGPIAGG